MVGRRAVTVGKEGAMVGGKWAGEGGEEWESYGG